MLKDHNTLGDRLVECRNRLGLKAGRAASVARVDPKEMGRYERNLQWPSLMMLARLAKVYHVTVSELLEGLEIPTERQRQKPRK